MDNENKLNNVVNIIKSYYSLGNEIVVIISALHGITDKILDICYHIKKVNKNSLCLFLKNIEIIHKNLIEKIILDEKEKSKLLQLINNLINEFRDVLLGISILGEVTPKSQDYLLSFGER
ncbi:MAG TPA: aspartate kinase, partial [Nitrososphaeraceae archaeon]|nr:aspartate kinase [Nitrososphaeraceae archaeon]